MNSSEQSLFPKKKILFVLSGILIAFVAVVLVIYSYNKQQTGIENKAQITAYCTEEILNKAKNSTVSAEEAKKYLECRPTILILKGDPTDEQAQEFVRQLDNKDGVYKVVYVSKDKALQIYKERYKNEPMLIEHVTRDILPASIEVYVTEPELKEKVVEFAKSSALVENVTK